MSRVGKLPVAVPSGVEVTLADKVIKAKGKLGVQEVALTDAVHVEHADGQVTVKPRDDTKHSRAMWGTTRAQIRNLFAGVSEGFTVNLDIIGVGYRAAVQGNNLQLQLGFSHDVIYPIPAGLTIKCETPTTIAISGANKQHVGQVAAELRSYRPPEPYKGKGVKYRDETVLRKEGKKK
ncbi:MAG: 50S ribosomal protein L6 [Alphaproteobacteria bacterium]